MPSVVSRRVLGARRGVGVLFVANALVFASIVTRYPELKDQFALNELAFGAMVACGPIGSVMGSLAAGRLIARAGAVPLAVMSSVVLGLLLVLAAFVSGPFVFAAVLFVLGVADATGDVADNAHGLDVQRHFGRSIINGLHGAWSAGAIAGGLIGVTALQFGVPRAIHFVVLGVVVAVASLSTVASLRLPFTQPAAVEPEPGRGRMISPLLLAAAAIAVVGAFLEDLGSTWGGVYVVEVIGAPAADAAFPFVAMMTALTVGRFVSDRLVDRVGAAGTVRLGSALAVVGVVGVAVASTGWMVVAGFGLVGLGIAPLIPLAMDAAQRAPGLDRGTGLAVVATVMRVGFLASPLLVGALADIGGLRVAMTVCVGVPALALLLPSALRPRAT